MKKFLSAGSLVLALAFAVQGMVFAGTYMQNTLALQEKHLHPVQGYTVIAPAPTYALLKTGSSGDAVVRLTERLKALGYLKGASDAYDQTVEAGVRKFQKANGLAVDGMAGKDTQTLLYEGNPVAYTPPQYTLLKIGSSGGQVAALTEQLKALGYVSAVSSAYTQMVEWGVRKFQAANGLTVDGMAGQKTQELLYEGNPAAYRLHVETLLLFAKSYLGTPYVYGANGPNSFDCSSYTQWVMKAHGIALPRTAYEQGYGAKFPKVSRGELIPGDLVFFNTIADSDLCDHVGIYLGNNQFIHASASASHPYVVISPLGGYYADVFSWGRRVL